jgi:hypothetical protein
MARDFRTKSEITLDWIHSDECDQLYYLRITYLAVVKIFPLRTQNWGVKHG